MTRYADPSRCPDCGAEITSGTEACARCRLPLRGLTAQRLFATLSHADELLAELRAAVMPAAAPATVPATGPAPSPQAWAPPPAPDRAAPTPSRGMSAVSVPRILLTLGAGCLLVAALVFLAVAWSVLGVGGRTAVLVGLTAVAGGLAAWMARRELRAACEALALVAFGLLSLDVVGADHAGWFGDLSTSGLLGLVGAVLAITGAASALAVRRTKITTLIGAEVVGAIGVGLVVLAIDHGNWLPLSVSLVLGTLVAAAGAVALQSMRLVVSAGGAGVVTAIAWLALLGYALGRVMEHDESWPSLWSGGHPVPLLVAAIIVAAPALTGRLALPARIAAAAIGHTLVVYALLAPVEQLDPTPATLAVLGVLVAASFAEWNIPRPWGLVNVLTQTIAGIVVFLVGALLAIQSLARLVYAADPVWGGAPADLLPRSPQGDIVAAPWLLPLCVAAVLVALWSVAHSGPALGRLAAPVTDLRVAATLLALALTATTALYPVPVWVPEAMLLLTGALFAAWWLGTRQTAPLALALGFTAFGTLVSLAADLLTAVALVVMLLLALLVHLRFPRSDLAGLAGTLLVATLAGSVWAWGAVLDGDAEWVALVGLLVVGATAVLAPYAPSLWWRCEDPVEARLGIEAGAAATAFPLAVAGVALARVSSQAEWTAVYLTVAGVVVVLMSLLRSDRRQVGWVGGLLLAMASWVRLWDLGVSTPEAYTLPSAAVLVVVGVLHLRRHPQSSTMTALAPGLSLALVPSLLWALVDPTGPRALLLGLGCLLLVLGGAGLRWTAPIVLGATVGAALVLRLAAPYIGDAVPRWVTIGTAGVLLLALGATWERRLGEVRQVVGYVRALR